jgi:methylmalonyl-CoA/ethylmalonyl-CoA epimerase
MYKKISHVAIAVKNLDDAVMRYTQVMGMTLKCTEEVADQKVKVAMLPLGESRIELVQPTSPDSPVQKFIDAKGEGIHHIAFEVDDLEASLNLLKYAGMQLIDQKPRIGAEGAKIAFVHPKALNGVLLELIETKK